MKQKFHGLHNTKEWWAWFNMRQRCNNPNATGYKNYGGRGIKVCKRWSSSFENFIDDMGFAPNKNFRLDRKNNNGNYTPKNCHWVNCSRQIINSRTRVDNSSGVRGVSFRSDTSKWTAYINIHGGRICLGSFTSLSRAKIVRKNAEKKYHNA